MTEQAAGAPGVDTAGTASDTAGAAPDSGAAVTARIEVTADGPYLVSGGLPLRRKRAVRTTAGEPVHWESDAALPTTATYALCRCGGSANKPFCDGSHQTQDWDPACRAAGDTYDDRAATYPGPGVVLRDDRSLCEHAGFCGTKTTNAWKMVAATDDTAVRSQLAAMVDRCPSGALTYRVRADGPDLEPDLAPGVGVVDDGPLFVTGRVLVTRPDGVPVERRMRMTLCRCGQSAAKPLCDGSHAAAGFADAAGDAGLGGDTAG